MAINIWERWPWTSFQNLNLDWLMKAAKEALTKATEASESVGTFDARITQNTNAIEQLGIDIETISSPVRVSVNSNLEAYYKGVHITGAELLAKVRQHGDLPYVEYNNEVYMLDSISNAGDMRFSMGHTVQSFDTLVMRHIMIPAASYNAAYSITNVSSGGSGSSNVFTVTITYRGDDATPEYTCDHTFAEITSQLSAGRTPVFVFKYGSGYVVSAVYDVSDTNINIYVSPSISSTNGSVNIRRYTIYSDNTIGINAAVTQLAALDNIIQFVNDGFTTNALLKTAQTLTAAEQAQVKQNLGISDGGGGTSGAVLYDTAQNLTDQQKAQARDNIGADSRPRVLIAANSANIPSLSPNTLYVFTGDATALSITLAAPTNNNVENEYHFIFNSGSTPTTITLPNTIRQPDGFTVEANHVYEVSILENNMTAQGWTVTP